MKFILITILSVCVIACSSKKSTTIKPHKRMKAEDISTVLKSSFTDFEDRNHSASSTDRYILRITPEEYEVFVYPFQNKLKDLAGNSFSYQTSKSSATTIDKNLSFFSISLGLDNIFDIIVTGSYDSTNQRLLINIYPTKLDDPEIILAQ
jgi:hypothetical protein